MSSSRARAARTVLGALTLVGCGAGGPASSVTTGAAPMPGVSSSAESVDAAVVVEPTGRTILRVGAVTAAPIGASLLGVADGASVFETFSVADERLGYAQLTGLDGPAGPAVELVDEWPIFAYADGAATTLVTSNGAALCPITIDAEGATTRGACFTQPGDALVRLGGKLVLLDVHPKVDDEEDAKKKAAKQLPKGAGTQKGAGKPPGKRTPGKRSKVPSQEQIKKRLFSSGKDVVVDAWILGPDAPAEPIETGLAYREAMAGMSFIGAGSRNERVDVAFYEFNAKDTKEPEGKLGYAQLDTSLALDPPTKRSFGESKLNAGFLSDHADMRLVTLPEGSLLLGHRGPRGKCDVTFVGPFVMQLIPEDKACAVDAQRLVRTARAIHKGTPTDTIPPPPELEVSKVRRALGQSAIDVGRTAYAGARAFAYEGERLVTFAEGEAPRELRRALTVERRRVTFAAWSREGRGLVETDLGLFELAGDEVKALASAPPTNRLGRGRNDVTRENTASAVRIAGSWWQAEGELRKLGPEPAAAVRELARGTDLVVGGAERGLLVENREGALDVSTIGADGAITAVGHHATPFGPRGLAAPRASGGAILVAPDRTHAHLDVVVLDERGGLVGAHAIDRVTEPGVRLFASALPAGGVVLHSASFGWALWLDEDGKRVAESAWERTASATPCPDGAPRPTTLPGPRPGTFIELGPREDAERGRRHCLVGTFQWRADGRAAWLGTRMEGAAVRAEFTVSEVFEEALGLSPSLGAAAATAPTASARAAACPGDMVHVKPDLCVDRWEGTLTDPSGVLMSPDYAATPDLFAFTLGEWATRRERGGDIHARAFPLPSTGVGERTKDTMRAASLPGVRPSGFVTGKLAQQACEAVGKRLCKTAEWQRACRGENDTMFPYGAQYETGSCNSRTKIHPAATLHDHAGMGHHDPRLNRVTDGGAPLLFETGNLPRCASRWGDDAIYDMVGNLDEWVDEKGGAFAGGFYARGSESGCESLITVHPPPYSDYSTGIRCCKDAAR